jgi:hypothetical protein
LNNQDARETQAVEQYRAALKARRKGLKSVSGLDGESVASVIERHESTLTLQRDLKKSAAEIAKLESDVVDFKTKFEEMMEENDQVGAGKTGADPTIVSYNA